MERERQRREKGWRNPSCVDYSQYQRQCDERQSGCVIADDRVCCPVLSPKNPCCYAEQQQQFTDLDRGRIRHVSQAMPILAQEDFGNPPPLVSECQTVGYHDENEMRRVLKTWISELEQQISYVSKLTTQ
jgi:hypothetical protein